MRPALRSVCALAAFALAACGGHATATEQLGGNGGADSGVAGAACNFDTDCAPPDFICDTVSNTCVQGCGLNPNCPPGKTCNLATGRCIISTGGGGDAGTDGGTGSDGGTDGGNTGGVASDTLCKACSVDSDCHAGGLCVQNPTHTGNYCTQDCTNDPCPTSYRCTVDRLNRHQCLPENGDCATTTGVDGGTGSDGGVDGGPVNDPSVPSDNPNGCGFCGQCAVNNDCVTGSVCVNGTCATGPCNSWLDCAFTGAFLASCTDVGLTDKYCMPLLGQCIALPPPLTPLAGDVGCVPSGTNPGCAAPQVPGPSMGGNVPVTQGLSPKPLLASEDSIVIDSQGRMAIGYIGVDSSGNSYMGVAQSTDNGAHWADKGKMKASTPVQSDPVLVVSKWHDSSGDHERMHYVWVGYTIVQQGGQYMPADMFMESSFSDDGGATWSQGIKVTTTTDNASGSLLLDKPWITVSPDAAQTLLINFSVGDNSQQHMFAAVSEDHGLSWRPKVQIENGDNNHGHNLGMPVFDPSDTTGNTVYDVFVTYTQIEAGAANSISLVKSADRGKTWSQPFTVSAGDDQVLFESPSIVADKNHHLYIGYTAAPGSAGSTGSRYWDAMVATVDISGATPVVARRVRVSDDQGGCFQHFHVMTAIDQATGKVFAGWLDNRQGGKGGTWYSVSSDGGATWSANKLVSDATYTFNPDHQNAQLNFLGDYFGFIFDGSKLRLAWSDPRNGTESQVFYAGGTP